MSVEVEFIVPDFLQGYIPEETDFDRLSPFLSNWLKTYDYVYNQEASEEDVAKMLLIEINGNARMQILVRLKRRFNRLRSVREDSELLHSCANG